MYNLSLTFVYMTNKLETSSSIARLGLHVTKAIETLTNQNKFLNM